jgi:hypothetical protein
VREYTRAEGFRAACARYICCPVLEPALSLPCLLNICYMSCAEGHDHKAGRMHVPLDASRAAMGWKDCAALSPTNAVLAFNWGRSLMMTSALAQISGSGSYQLVKLKERTVLVASTWPAMNPALRFVCHPCCRKRRLLVGALILRDASVLLRIVVGWVVTGWHLAVALDTLGGGT